MVCHVLFSYGHGPGIIGLNAKAVWRGTIHGTNMGFFCILFLFVPCILEVSTSSVCFSCCLCISLHAHVFWLCFCTHIQHVVYVHSSMTFLLYPLPFSIFHSTKIQDHYSVCCDIDPLRSGRHRRARNRIIGVVGRVGRRHTDDDEIAANCVSLFLLFPGIHELEQCLHLPLCLHLIE